MSLALTVTITDGTLSDLALTAANGYRNPRGGIGPGERVWRRQRVTSPYVHGGVLVGQVLDIETVNLHILVEASSSTQLETRMAALLDRMEQPSYVLQVAIDSQTYRWQCEPADSSIGDEGAFDALNFMRFRQALRFLVPRQPVPLAGVL